MSNFQSILDAFDKYAEQIDIDLNKNPFAVEINGCDSPDAVLRLLQVNLEAFEYFRNKNRKIIDCLGPVVQFVHSFSGILGEAAGLTPFQPAKLIFVGINVLFTAADGVSASYDALLELFECLGNFLKRLHIYSGVSLDPLMTDIIAKIMVELISILALARNQISQGRFKQFAKKLLGDTKIEKILKRLDRLTQEEARMTVAQTLAIVHGLLDNMKVVMDGGEASTGAIRKTLVTMQEVTDAINKMRRNYLQKEARSWISPPDPSKNHTVALRIHSGKSTVWFTRGRTFETWNLQGGLLWIHGKPGSGKTILCSSIIEEVAALRVEGLGLVAYYYFDFGETAKQDVRGLLSSLVVQLCAKSDLCYDILYELYSKHDAGLHLPDDDTLTQCLKDMLKLAGLPPIYIVIDALDECPNSFGVPSPRELVFDLIEDLIGLHLPVLRICVTSRPGADIQAALGPLVSQSVSLHDEVGQKQDIVDYISFTVQSDRRMKQWKAEDRDLVIDTLSRRADGMFQWVTCQIVWLRDCLPQDIRRALDELPETLDATYERILLSIKNPRRREYACRLLQCLAVSIRPLRVEELAEVLAVRLDVGEDSQYRTDWRPTDPREAVLSTCSSLVTINDVDGSSVVQFSHFSVKEFLMSSRLADAGKHLSLYHILPHSAHAVLARTSLSVLLNLGDQVDKSTVEKQRPFAIYAARYWVDHGKFEGVSSSIEDLMKRLFDPEKPYFATWVWIYDVDRPWKGSMTTVHPTQPETGPLYYAALCGFRSLVDHLTLTHPIYVNASGGVHGTPLHAALFKEEVEAALALLENGANIDALDRTGSSSLHGAAFAGRSAIVKLLLERKADVNLQTKNGHNHTPLHLAAQAKQLEVCRLLLEPEHGADVAIRNTSGRAALHIACHYGHLDIVRELLAHGADADAQDNYLSTPLHWASFSGHIEVVQLLVQHGAALNKANEDQATPLHLTPRHRKLEIVHYLIKQGASTMSKDKDGDTPLHNASRRGHLDLVEVFLKGSADANARNANEETPLNIASALGNLEIVRCLIKPEHGADVNGCDKRGWAPVHTAARNGHLDIVRLFLDLGIDVHVRTGNHETPLMLASIGGHVEVSRFLIEHQADVNSVNDEGWTSLHSASRHGHADVVQLLLDHGAHVNVQKLDLSGCAALHLASASGHLKVAECLIERGAEIDVRNEDKKTPLDLASGTGELEVARLLVTGTRGSDVNLQDNEGWTPLHSAAWNGHLSLVGLLVDSGADVGIQNSNEKTPLDLARENGKRDVTSFLERHSGIVCALDTANSTSLEVVSKDSLLEVAEPQVNNSDLSDDEECDSLDSALANGRIDMVQRLLDRSADVNERNKILQTALEAASKDGKPEIVKILIECGADVNHRSPLGVTPLHLAALYGHVGVARLLLHKDADINVTQYENCTALHLASITNRFEIVQLLLERGADVQTRCTFGKTAIQYASTCGCREVFQLLSDHGMGGV